MRESFPQKIEIKDEQYEEKKINLQNDEMFVK
jgi:hypothetical protein